VGRLDRGHARRHRCDTVLLTVGRLGNRPRIGRLISRLGLAEERRGPLTRRIRDQFPQVVVGAKLVDVAAEPAYLPPGLDGLTNRRFLCWIGPASAVRAAVLVAIGYAAGNSLLTAFGAHPGLVTLGGLAALRENGLPHHHLHEENFAF
jgi:membrane-associated protein